MLISETHAQNMATSEMKDAYDLEYYERTGGNEASIQSQMKKIEDIQSEMLNVKTELNKMSRNIICLLGVVIFLLSFISTGLVFTMIAK